MKNIPPLPSVLLFIAALCACGAVSAGAVGLATSDMRMQAAATLSTSVRVLPLLSPAGPRVTAAREEKKETASMLFAGDVMPSRFVAVRMREKGYDYPFSSVKEMLSAADLAFVNLESPVTPGRTIQNGEMTFRGDPEFLPAMREAGVDVVSLANNHSPNMGADGLADTMRRLDERDIAHVGSGNAARAYAPVSYDLYGMRVAFIAQNDTDVVPPEYCAEAQSVGTACKDLARASSSIALARKFADIVVFTMHAGDEYTHEPNARQKALARAAIDAGADLVIGHHPHVVQRAEIYKGKRIYYSLGNFIFDQNWSRDTRMGLVVMAKIDRNTKKIVDFEHKVIRIDDYSRPTPATTNETAEILARLGL